MTRYVIAAAVGLVLCAMTLAAGEKASPKDAQVAIHGSLNKVKFEGRLSGAFDYWQNASGAAVVVDWPRLRAAGVTPDAAVKIQIENAKAFQVLDVILSSSGSADQPLGWWVGPAAVHVSTLDYVLYRGKVQSAAGTAMRGAIASSMPSQPATRAAPARVQFADAPLENVVQYFRQTSGLNLFVQWRALEQVGINRDTTVSLDVSDVSLGKALDLVLDQLSADKGRLERLYWVVDEGIVTISTGQALNREVTTKVIDITDMLAIVPDFEPPSVNVLSSSGVGTGNNAATVSPWIANQPAQVSGPTRAQVRQALEDNILGIIKDSIGADMWQPEGKGSVRLYNGNLIISQTPLGFKLLEKTVLPR
jgi:hypothetical protein